MIGRKLVAALLALGVLAGLAGCPAPSPAPKPRPEFPGNVSLTFWLTQDQHPTSTSYKIGPGRYQSHSCDDSCHWDVTAKPDQVVTATTLYAAHHDGHLVLEVVQNNNGRQLCYGDNSAAGDKGPVNCTGKVII